MSDLTEIVAFRSYTIVQDYFVVLAVAINDIISIILLFRGLELIEIVLAIELLNDLLKSLTGSHAMFIILTILKVGL